MNIKIIPGGLKNKLSAPVIMLLAALLIAGTASFLIYRTVQNKSNVAAAKTETQAIVVSSFDMKWGTVITKEFIKTQPYLKTSLPAGYLADPSAAVGRVVIYPIKANEPITESRLAPANVKAGGLAAVVAPSKRAMGVKVDKVVGVSGFIHPGNKVDVLVSLSKSDNVSAPITKIVLENITVLAVGVEVEQASEKKEKAAPVDVITLEVTPEEGERLALAAVQGKLQLALRNYSDVEDVKTKGTTIPKLLGSYSADSAQAAPAKKTKVVKRVASVKPAAVAAPSRTYTVELIKGTKSSQEKLTMEDGQ